MSTLVKPRMTTRDKITLAILVLMSVFLYADMNAITPVVTDIMADTASAKATSAWWARPSP